MTTHTCDKCGIELKGLDAYRLGQLGYETELCEDCFLPYLRRLKRDKILPKTLAARDG